MEGRQGSRGDLGKGKYDAILSTVDLARHEGGGSPTLGPPPMEHDDDEGTRDPLREANRIHCKQTRERRKRREQLLREEVEVLTLCKAIVDNGPDMFSLHRVDERAPFSYLCKNFYQRLRVGPEDILGQPLASVVDPRDRHALALTLREVLGARDQTFGQGGKGHMPGLNGSLVHLRVTSGGVTSSASMTLVIGSQGLVVVTRLYPSEEASL